MSSLVSSMAWLRKRFLEDKRTMAEMAREAQVSERTIRRALKEKGIIK